MDIDERKERMITNNAERLAVAIETFYKPGMTVEDLRSFLKTKGYGVESIEKAVAIWFRDFWTRPAEEPKKEEKKEPIGGKHHLFDLMDIIRDDILYKDIFGVYLKSNNPGMRFADLGAAESKTAFTVYYIPDRKVKAKATILGMQKDQRLVLLNMCEEVAKKIECLGILKKLEEFADIYTLRIYPWNNFDEMIKVIKATEVEVPQKPPEKIEIKPLTWHHVVAAPGTFTVDFESKDLSGWTSSTEAGELSKSEEPKMKRGFAIYEISPISKYIYFDTDPETANSLKKYGSVSQWTDLKCRYRMAVDGRYDFEDVVDRLRKFEKESTLSKTISK